MGKKMLIVMWLGEEDSNPCTVVQSHVSYHWTIPQKGGPDYHRRGTSSTRTGPWSYEDLSWDRSQRRRSTRRPAAMTRSNPRAKVRMASQCSPRAAPTHPSASAQTKEPRNVYSVKRARGTRAAAAGNEMKVRTIGRRRVQNATCRP